MKIYISKRDNNSSNYDDIKIIKFLSKKYNIYNKFTIIAEQGNLIRNLTIEENILLGKCEVEMFDIIKTIAQIFDYNGEILWDNGKPEGQLRKPSCNKKFLNIVPNFKYTGIDDGLLHVCKWFANQYPNVRGVLK